MLPLTEKYRVKTFAEIKGQDEVIKELDFFYKKFPKKRALILNGNVGTGKTSMAIALANEYNLEIFELNASDLRNRLKLEEVLKPATLQKPLFKKGKLILMDEADGITADDRGGLPELIFLIENTNYPIIITANDIWQNKFSPLRKKCQIVSVKDIEEKIIMEIISDIIRKERKSIKQEIIILIAKKSRGDVRAALNDLQAVLELGENIFISKEKEREKKESVYNALKEVFQSQTSRQIIEVFDNTDLNLDEILLWIEENIPSEYKGSALANAYNSLSKADVFRGRIYRQQYWRFLVYQNFFLTAGISSATMLKSKKFTKYSKPSRILKIWLSNQKNANKKSIVAKYAEQAHMSKRKAYKEAFLLPLILNPQAQKRLDLNEKEIQWLEERKEQLINNLKVK